MKPKYSNPLLPRLLGAGFASLITLSGFATSAEIAYRTAATSDAEATNPANWGDGTVAPGASDIAAWTTAGFNGESRGGGITVSSPVSWGGARFEDSSGPITLTGSPITLGASGITEVRWEAITIGNDIVLGADQTWAVGNNSLTIQGALSGAFNLTKSGGNTLNLDSPANLFSGTLLATAGTVNIGDLFGGSVTQSGGTVNIDGSVDGNVAVSGGTLNNYGGIGGTLTVTGGTVVNDAEVAGTTDITGGSVTHYFDFLDSVTVGGTGSLALVDLSTIDGNLTVNTGGTVSGLTEIFSDLILAGGTLVVDGAGSSSILASNIDISSASTVTVNGVPAGGAGPIVIAEYGTSVTGIGNLSLSGSSFRSPAFSDNGSAIELNYTTDTRTWNNTSTDGIWTTGASANWVEGDNLFFNGDTVVFGDAAPGTVTMSGTLSPGGVSFTNTTGNDYTLAGGTDGMLSGGTGVSVSGGGVVTLGGVNGQNYSGAISVTNGSTLKMGSRDAFGQSSGITVESGSTVDLNGQTPGAVPTGGYEYTIAGTGVGGAGAITNTGAANFSNAGVKSVILSGDATINTNSRFDIGFANQAGGGVIEGNGFTLTKEGTGDMGFRGDGSGSAINIIVNGGNVWAENSDFGFGGASGNVTVNNTSKIGTYGDRTVPASITLAPTAGMYNAGGGTGTYSGTITAASGTTIDTSGGGIAIDGDLAGAGTITRVGANALYLQNTATGFSGKISSETGGTLRIESNAALGTATGADVLTLGGGVTLQGGTLALQTSATIGSATQGITTTGNVNFGAGPANTITIDGPVTGTGNLTKNNNAGDALIFNEDVTTDGKFTGNNGTLTFNGNISFDGGLDVGSGMVTNISGTTANIGNDVNGFHAWSGTTNINIVSGTFADLELGDGNNQVHTVNHTAGDVTVTHDARFGHWGGETSVYNISGGSLNQPDTVTSPTDEAQANLMLGIDGSGILNISGTGEVNTTSLVVNGRSNGNNNGEDALNITGGRLNLGKWGMRNGGVPYAVNFGGGTVGASANWNSSLAISLTGTGGDTTFDTLDSVDGTTPRTINLTGNLTGSGGMVKTGAGTLSLSGSGNAFTGKARVEEGDLYLFNTATVSSLELAGGDLHPGTTGAAGTVSATATTFAGGNAIFRVGTSVDLISTGSLDVTSPTNIVMAPLGELTAGDEFTVIDYSGSITGFGDLALIPLPNPRYSTSLVHDTVNTMINVKVDAVDSLIWTGATDQNWDHATTNWKLASDDSPTMFIDLDSVLFDGTAAGTVTLTEALPASLVTVNSASNYTFDGAGGLSGNASILKQGSSTLTINSANSHLGGNSIEAGSIAIGSPSALGGAGSVTTIASGASLDVNGNDLETTGQVVKSAGTINNSANGGVISSLELTGDTSIDIAANMIVGTNSSSSGSLNLAGNTLTKTGPGQLTLNGVTVSTGNITVDQGALRLIKDYNNNQRTVVLNSPGTLTVNSGASVITDRWGATLTFSMPIVLNGGTLGSDWPGPNGATISSPISVTADSAFNFGGGYGNVTFSGVISGTGKITRTGGETVTLTGENTTSGGFAVNSGTLRVGNGGTTGTLGSGPVTVNSTLSFNRSNNLTVANNIGGTGVVVKDGSGNLTLFGLNSYTGNTTVNTGALNLADGGTLAFKPGANGSSNKIGGAGAFTADGDFVLDLSGADLTDGNSWLLVDVGALAFENFSGTFNVTDGVNTFSKSSGVHTLVDGPNTWTFTEADGTLSLTVAAGYSTWAATNAPTGTAADDYDGDGVANGVEWLLGGDAATNDIGKLPTVSSDATSLTLTFVCDEDALTSADTGVEIEVGTTLAGWPTVFTVPTAPVVNNPGVTVVDNTDGTFTVTLVVLKAADAEKFARLKVTID
ncbi:MAG: autotransporter-associated beta strand repeat-containing protein [Akkermansiaceae bacterium]|nr:autotransporter-associated beta strand repeat-containing protein [Akkermansiaceae bacterium]